MSVCPDAFTRLGQELAAARALFSSPPKPLAACLLAAAQKRTQKDDGK